MVWFWEDTGHMVQTLHAELAQMHIPMEVAFYFMLVEELWPQVLCNLFAVWLLRSWEWNYCYYYTALLF